MFQDVQWIKPRLCAQHWGLKRSIDEAPCLSTFVSTRGSWHRHPSFWLLLFEWFSLCTSQNIFLFVLCKKARLKPLLPTLAFSSSILGSSLLAPQAIPMSLVFLEARRTFFSYTGMQNVDGFIYCWKVVVQIMEARELSFQLDRAAWGSPEHMDPAHGCYWPSVSSDGSAWEGCGRSGQAENSWRYSLSSLICYGVWGWWGQGDVLVSKVMQRHALHCWKGHGAERNALGSGVQLERQRSSVWFLPWASPAHARWIRWLILSLLWLVFDFSSWITPDLFILWPCEQHLARERD